MAGSRRRKSNRRRRKRREDENDDLIAALGHPVRREILRRMSDGREASPRELATAMDEDLSSVAYHVRTLLARGALRPAGGPQVSGAGQHVYRWSVEAAWVRAMLEEEGGRPA